MSLPNALSKQLGDRRAELADAESSLLATRRDLGDAESNLGACDASNYKQWSRFDARVRFLRQRVEHLTAAVQTCRANVSTAESALQAAERDAEIEKLNQSRAATREQVNALVDRLLARIREAQQFAATLEDLGQVDRAACARLRELGIIVECDPIVPLFAVRAATIRESQQALTMRHSCTGMVELVAPSLETRQASKHDRLEQLAAVTQDPAERDRLREELAPPKKAPYVPPVCRVGTVGYSLTDHRGFMHTIEVEKWSDGSLRMPAALRKQAEREASSSNRDVVSRARAILALPVDALPPGGNGSLKHYTNPLLPAA